MPVSEEAMDSWITSFSYFNELKKCYLIDGSIAVDNPQVKTIKSDHMEVARLAGEDVRKIAKFYKVNNRIAGNIGGAIIRLNINAIGGVN